MLGRNRPSFMPHSGKFFYVKLMAEESRVLGSDYVPHIAKMVVIPNNIAIIFKTFKASTRLKIVTSVSIPALFGIIKQIIVKCCVQQL